MLPLLERKTRFDLTLVVFPEAPALEQAVGAAGMLPPGLGAALPGLAALETEGICTVEIQPPTHWTVVVGKPGWSDEPLRIVPEDPDLEWQTDSDIATLASDGGSFTITPVGRFQSSRDGIETRVDSEAVIRDAVCTLWRGRKKVDGAWDERRQAYVFPITPQPGGSGRPPLHLAVKARIGPDRLYQQAFERVIEEADSAERALQASFNLDADLLEGREDFVDRGLAILAESDARAIRQGFWLEAKLQQIAFLLGFADTAGRSFARALDLHRRARERLANSLTELFMELIFNFLDLLKAYKAGGKEGTEEAAKAKLKDVAKETGESIQKKLAARKGVLESVRDRFRAVLEAHQGLIESLQKAARQVRQQLGELATQIEKGSPRLQELRKQAQRYSNGYRTFILDTDKLLNCPPGQRAQLIESIRQTIPAENAFLQGLLGRLAGAKKNMKTVLDEAEDAVRRQVKELEDNLAKVAEEERQSLLRQSEALGNLLSDQEAAAAAVRKNLTPTEQAVQELETGIQNADTWMRRSRELLQNPEAVTPEGVKAALEEISKNALPDSAAIRQSLDTVAASQSDSVSQIDRCLRALGELPEGALPAETGAALAGFLESRRSVLRRHLSEPAEEFLSDRVTDAAKASPDQLRSAMEDARAIEYKGYPMRIYADQPAGTLWYLVDNAIPLAEYYLKTAAQWVAGTWLGKLTLNFFVRLIMTMARAVAKYMTFLERVYSAAWITTVLPGAHRRRGIDAAGLPDDFILSRDRDTAGLFGLVGDGITTGRESHPARIPATSPGRLQHPAGRGGPHLPPPLRRRLGSGEPAPRAAGGPAAGTRRGHPVHGGDPPPHGRGTPRPSPTPKRPTRGASSATTRPGSAGRCPAPPARAPRGRTWKPPSTGWAGPWCGGCAGGAGPGLHPGGAGGGAHPPGGRPGRRSAGALPQEHRQPRLRDAGDPGLQVRYRHRGGAALRYGRQRRRFPGRSRAAVSCDRELSAGRPPGLEKEAGHAAGRFRGQDPRRSDAGGFRVGAVPLPAGAVPAAAGRHCPGRSDAAGQPDRRSAEEAGVLPFLHPLRPATDRCGALLQHLRRGRGDSGPHRRRSALLHQLRPAGRCRRPLLPALRHEERLSGGIGQAPAGTG